MGRENFSAIRCQTKKNKFSPPNCIWPNKCRLDNDGRIVGRQMGIVRKARRIKDLNDSHWMQESVELVPVKEVQQRNCSFSMGRDPLTQSARKHPEMGDQGGSCATE